MNVVQQALAVYQQAVANMKAKKATPADELIVALWDQTQEQEATIAAQAYKISVLETKEQYEFDKQELLTEAMATINKVRYNIH